MPTYSRFEDLPAWKDAARLYITIESLVADHAFDNHGDMRDQILRASLLVSNNIAEGFERGTTEDLLWFLYIARGSAGEVRSMLRVMSGSPRFRHLKSEISDLKSKAESISRQIGAWASSLQESDIKGQRHLTEGSRAAYERRKRADEVWDKIQRMNRGEQVDWTKPEE